MRWSRPDRSQVTRSSQLQPEAMSKATLKVVGVAADPANLLDGLNLSNCPGDRIRRRDISLATPGDGGRL
jgi:hypothetical protein